MMVLLENVKHFIEEENYNALEVIYNAELANLLAATFQTMMHDFALWVIKES